MIIIDKLCYRSKLRYVSAAEKLLYAVSSLMICVLTRSYAAALIVFIANGILTVGKGKIPLSCYVRLLMIPIVFLIVGTGAVFLNLSKVPMDAFAVPVGEIYITASRESAFWAVNLCITALAAVTCLYFLSLNTTMTDILGALRKMHMPRLLIELMMLIYSFLNSYTYKSATGADSDTLWDAAVAGTGLGEMDAITKENVKWMMTYIADYKGDIPGSLFMAAQTYVWDHQTFKGEGDGDIDGFTRYDEIDFD